MRLARFAFAGVLLSTAAVLLFALALGAGGCVAPDLQPTYVAADKATFDAIAQSYLDYVDGDPTLDEAARDRRRDLVESWWHRIEQASEGGQE